MLKKLNYKGQQPAFIMNLPKGGHPLSSYFGEFGMITNDLAQNQSIEFCVIFVWEISHIEHYAPIVGNNALGDAVIWFAYPKKSSKKYQSNINRDFGWKPLGKYRLEGVRQVAIDEDWSALRFRKLEYIKTLRRKFALNSQENES